MQPEKRYFLGVDAGGTKTKALITDRSGQILGEGKSGGADYRKVGFEQAEESLFSAVNEAVGRAKKKIYRESLIIEVACLGMAGLDTRKDREVFLGIIKGRRLAELLGKRPFLVNDSLIGLRSGTEKNYGLCLIAGTGTNCYGVNKKGEEARAGDWGYLLGDQGSGYAVSKKALQAIFRAYDGRGEKTLLTDLILSYLKVEKIPDLVGWAYRKNQGTVKMVASLADLVDQATKRGDTVAQRIIDEAADDLLSAVNAVAMRLNMEKEKFPLVFIGGLLKPTKELRKKVERKIAGAFRGVNFVTPEREPAWGAISLAIEKAG